MSTRPTLTLGSAFARKTPEPVQDIWKCKPCGAQVDLPPLGEGDDDDRVRCPSCSANLGRLGDFRRDPPMVQKLRARPASPPAPEPIKAPEIRKRKIIIRRP